MTGRDTLPVYMIGPDRWRPLWDVLADLNHLRRQGLLSNEAFHEACPLYAPPQDSYEQGRALLESLGHLGCYDAHVRATGRVYTCPHWCVADDHPRQGLYDPDHDGPPGHVAYRVNLEAGSIYVDASTDGEPNPGIDASINLDRITADQAREYAAALVEAADHLDRLLGAD